MIFNQRLCFSYCNSLYYGLSKTQLTRLQHIQNSLARAIVAAARSSDSDQILKSLHWLKVQERIEYKIISTTYKVLQSSLPSSLHDPLGRRHWSLSFTHKLSRVSKSLTILFGMRHLTYGTNFLHLFAFLVSRPPQSTLLHCQALTLLLNRWLACLTGSFILVLKLNFSPDPFPRNLPLSLTD